MSVACSEHRRATAPEIILLYCSLCDMNYFTDDRRARGKIALIGLEKVVSRGQIDIS
jgi:hypothetical protein